MKALNIICFTICIICIVLATVMAFALIWGGGDRELLWKGELSVLVLFLASAATLNVSQTLAGKSRFAPGSDLTAEKEGRS